MAKGWNLEPLAFWRLAGFVRAFGNRAHPVSASTRRRALTTLDIIEDCRHCNWSAGAVIIAIAIFLQWGVEWHPLQYVWPAQSHAKPVIAIASAPIVPVEVWPSAMQARPAAAIAAAPAKPAKPRHAAQKPAEPKPLFAFPTIR